MPSIHNTDVLVIGGGIIGASIAWRLAQKNFQVCICDAAKLGGEASWAGAGMLVPGSEFDEPGEWLSFALESLRLYPSFVAELESCTGAPIDFSQDGSLELAADDHEWQTLRSRLVKQSALGIRGVEVPRSELIRRIPAIDETVAGAILYPEEGQVDPRTVMHALRIALTREGVDIREGDKASRIHGASVTLYSGQVIQARRVVLAAGAWSSMIDMPGIPPVPECFPMRGHLTGFELPPDTLAHVLRFHHTYIVQRRNGFLIAGASEEAVGFNRHIDAATADDIATRAGRLWRVLQGKTYQSWTGFRPATHEPGPVLGRWQSSSLWLAYGHYRNGILLAPATANRIAGEISASLEKD